jgi:hypothetical protein
MRRLANIIKLNINEIGREVVVWIQVARSIGKWWALINRGSNQISVSAKHQDIINKIGKY